MMSNRPVLVAASVLSISAMTIMAPRANAWGFEGHRIIGDIAAAFLTPQAKAALVDLLAEQSLGDAGCWADQIRGQANYEWVRPLHYINVPRDAQAIDLARDCPHGACVVGAITRFREVAQDTTRPRPERVEALKLLIHFIGDIHQPLHVSYADDRGGNSIPLSFLGAKTNLHRLWDTNMIEHHGQRKTWAAQLIARDNHAEVQSAQQVTDPARWADETLAITRGLYAELAEQKNDQLGEPYYQGHLALLEQQLALAGARLAGTLNAMFAAVDGCGHAPADYRAAAREPNNVLRLRLNGAIQWPDDAQRTVGDTVTLQLAVEGYQAKPDDRVEVSCDRSDASNPQLAAADRWTVVPCDDASTLCWRAAGAAPRPEPTTAL